MPRRTALTDDDSQRLKGIVDSLDTQSAIAASAGVGQPWLSYVLRGRRTKNVDSTRLDRLATELAVRVRNEHAAGEFSEERASTELNFLGRFTPTAGGLQPDLHPPGGPVPPDAIPYVTCSDDTDPNWLHDARLTEALTMSASDLLLWGPPQSGKSTAIARIERRALQLGYETAWFDPQPISANPASSTYEDGVDAIAASAIRELLQVRWGLGSQHYGPVDSITTLNNWLILQLAPTASKKRLLIIDDLANLGKGAAARWTSLHVRLLFHLRRTSNIRLSIVFGVTHQFASNFPEQVRQVSDHFWTTPIEVRWFTFDEVRDLVTQLHTAREMPPVEALSSELYETFCGQPYLTHAAALDKELRTAAADWKRTQSTDAALRLRRNPRYRRHRAAITLALFGPSYKPESEESRRLLDEFVALSGAANRPVALLPEHRDFFVKSRLVDADEHNALRKSLSIYSLISEDLKAEDLKRAHSAA